MSPTAWLLLAAMLVFDTASHLLLKASADRAEHNPRPMHFLRRLIREPLFWLTAAAFMGVLVLWVAFYSLVPLGQGVMATCITITGVMVGGRICFGERITPARALAAGLIGAGVLLVGWAPA